MLSQSSEKKVFDSEKAQFVRFLSWSSGEFMQLEQSFVYFVAAVTEVFCNSVREDALISLPVFVTFTLAAVGVFIFFVTVGHRLGHSCDIERLIPT